MNRLTRLILVPVLLVTAVSSLSASARADRAFTTPVAAASTSVSDPVQDGWAGGVGAIACGFGIRFWPVFGWNLGYNALMTISCMLMILDAMS